MARRIGTTRVATLIAAGVATALLILGAWNPLDARQQGSGTAGAVPAGKTAEPRTVPGQQPEPSKAVMLPILAEAERSARDLRDARSKAEMFLAIATLRVRVHDRKSARGAFGQAIQAADAIADERNRVYTLETIAAAQLDAGDRGAAITTLAHVREVVDAMADEFQRLNARSWIVRAISRAGDLDGALKMALDLPGTHMLLKARAMTNVLEGLRPEGLPALKKAMPGLLQAVAKVGSPTFEADCLRGFAQVLADCGDVEDLVTIAGILEKAAAQHGPNDATGCFIIDAEIGGLESLAKAQSKAGRREAAIQTFEKALELAREMPPEGEALRSGRLGRLAYERVEAGDVDGALQTAELVVYEYYKATALIEIAEANARAGRRDASLDLFRRAVQAAQEIQARDPVRDRAGSLYLDRGECLRSIAFGQARAGFTAEAIGTAETIVEPRWKDSALSLIATAMARRGEVASAVELAEKIGDEQARQGAMQRIAEARAASGDVPGALEWARNRPDPEARAHALLGIMKALVEKQPAGH